MEDDRHWVDIAAQEAEQVCGCRPDLFSTVPGEAFMCTENLSDAIAPWRSSTFKRRKFNVFIPFSGKTDTLWAYYLCFGVPGFPQNSGCFQASPP